MKIEMGREKRVYVCQKKEYAIIRSWENEIAQVFNL